MGVVSRKIFPACESMCVCCPALRSRSRQPVKRYKKLLAEIFPKSNDGSPNERKIVKLCEYAVKNPIRIPKIADYLEERCYKEVRSGNLKFIGVVTEVFNKMMSVCKEQMVYFAANLYNVVDELLENSKQDAAKILGLQTLANFIYSQRDGSIYALKIEKYLHKVCLLACESGEEHQKRCLRASSLQCLSAMVWFMKEDSYIFMGLDEIVHVTLDNYYSDMSSTTNDQREQLQNNWVNEVIRCEGRGTGVSGDTSPSSMLIRAHLERKDPSLLTREEMESPKVWSQVCLQRMVELAQESATLRLVLDPIFAYIDSRREWNPSNGLAMIVLADITYLMERSGNQQLVLSSVVRHLDHKNVVHDPELKTLIAQVAAALAKKVRSRAVLGDITFVSDLCRHLRKSLQAMVGSVGEQERNLNVNLQRAIEDCLLETAKGVGDTRQLFDMMAISLEKLPSSGIVSQGAIGSLLIFAHAISAAFSSRVQQMFPEALLIQLLKVMLHPNVETRIGAHRIFSVLLLPSSSYYLREARSGYPYEPHKWCSENAPTSASIASLLKKLRKEKDGVKLVKNGYNHHEDHKNCDVPKTSPNFNKLSAIIDWTSVPHRTADSEPFIFKFTEDQLAQLLSSLWVQVILPDNLPSNIEAISHSFSLALLSLRLKNQSDNLIVRVFQLLLSLRNLALDPNNGTLPPVCQRSILLCATGMLMFATKIYHIPHVGEMLKSVFPEDVDPYLGLSSDMQVYTRPEAKLKVFGSLTDNQMAISILSELRDKIHEPDHIIEDILVKNLATITKLDEHEVQKQVSEKFTPDDAYLYGPKSFLDLEQNQTSKESLSFDEDIQPGSVLVDDAISESSAMDPGSVLQRKPTSPAISHIISVGQLMESALEVAGQVVGSSVSTSPLPYDLMANHCEALGTGTRKKLSSWLANERNNRSLGSRLSVEVNEDSIVPKMNIGDSLGILPRDPCIAMRLPPASPFDNFLKAAGC